ncbi:MAG: dTDP-glucose 4,6-dehydratase [Candidatus Nomurabacteria bacterium]|nr:dTDP-glucose 4,6-dehydratase [Candidatus Nomurabacteria bacterium]
MKYDKTILVTGGMGFIGSNFLNTYVLKYKNYFFINIDSLVEGSNVENILVNKASNYHFEKIDIRNKEILEKVFIEFNITDIIHFAAQSNVDDSIKNPTLFIETNINGTNNLLELALKYKINRFYQISTDEVFGSLEKNEKPFTTNSNLSPNNPYSASKAGAELLARSYNKTFGLNTIISRCSNNFGPNQRLQSLIPKFITYLIEGKKIPVYGNGENIRDWIYVFDHIEAVDLLFHKGISGSVYNIGANNEISNKDIVKILLKITNRDESYIENAPDRLGHDFRYAIDTSELFKDFGWKAKTNFEDGIKKTFEFYKK